MFKFLHPSSRSPDVHPGDRLVLERIMNLTPVRFDALHHAANDELLGLQVEAVVLWSDGDFETADGSQRLFGHAAETLLH